MRVASVPHGHVYVEHLASPDGPDGVTRLPDPPPENPVVGAPWWPLVMLDAGWVDAHAAEFDLYHLHFGFDSTTPQELRRILDRLRAHRTPFVYTVHDLRNPHQADRRAHDAALDVLIPGADELITLTPGAAAEIRARWGRDAHVVPHPHIVPLERMSRETTRASQTVTDRRTAASDALTATATAGRPAPPRRPTVGLHLKSLRANLNPLPLLDLLIEHAPARGIDVLVDVHTDVVTPGMDHYDAEVTAVLRAAAGHPGVTLHVHDFYSDDELWDYFQGLDLSVLAYRFGTHSGWLEACYDLGTRVLAPRLGYYHEQQQGVLGYDVAADGTPDPRGVIETLDALSRPSTWRADPQQRLEQRRGIAQAHRDIYQRALARVRA